MFDAETTQRPLLDKGFIALHDPAVGSAVLEMGERGFQYLTPFGLKYYRRYILGDDRIRAVVESSLGQCSLVHWLRYNARPDHIECFRSGGEQAGLRLVAIQQFCKGSEVQIWHNSHLHDLPTTDGVRSLHETTRDELARVGCVAELKIFQSGGLVIRDGRTYAEIIKGYTITFVFAVADSVSSFPKIMLGNYPALVRLAKEMESPKIKLNIAFQDWPCELCHGHGISCPTCG